MSDMSEGGLFDAPKYIFTTHKPDFMVKIHSTVNHNCTRFFGTVELKHWVVLYQNLWTTWVHLEYFRSSKKKYCWGNTDQSF